MAAAEQVEMFSFFINGINYVDVNGRFSTAENGGHLVTLKNLLILFFIGLFYLGIIELLAKDICGRGSAFLKNKKKNGGMLLS